MRPKTVRIYGSAKNLRETPIRTPEEQDIEVWMANSPTTILLRHPPAKEEWTRWFNLHSRKHITGTYPSGWSYYKDKAAGRPIYLLKQQPEIPTSVAFPREAIQAAFAPENGGRPMRYFTCTICWLLALAILEGFERIELWGYELRDTKPGSAFAYERPCFFYWVQQARTRGVEVIYQKEVEKLPFLPGDPLTYTGVLYGYDTKPEEGWDKDAGDWKKE